MMTTIPFLHDPITKVLSPGHLLWVDRIVDLVTAKDYFWKEICNLTHTKDLSLRKGKKALLLQGCKSRPAEGFLKALAPYFHLDGQDPAAGDGKGRLVRLADWKLRHVGLLDLATTDDEIRHLEELFQLSQWVWTRTGVLRKPSFNGDLVRYEWEKLRLDTWRAVPDPFAESDSRTHPWSEEFRAHLETWWKAVVKADDHIQQFKPMNVPKGQPREILLSHEESRTTPTTSESHTAKAPRPPLAPPIDEQIPVVTQLEGPHQEILSILDRVHFMAPFWDDLEGFLGEVRVLFGRKQIERLSNNSWHTNKARLEKLQSSLVGSTFWGIEGLDAWSRWDIQSFQDADSSHFSSLLAELTTAVDEAEFCIRAVEDLRSTAEELRHQLSDLRLKGNRAEAVKCECEARMKEEEASRLEMDEYDKSLRPRVEKLIRELGELRPDAEPIGTRVISTPEPPIREVVDLASPPQETSGVASPLPVQFEGILPGALAESETPISPKQAGQIIPLLDGPGDETSFPQIAPYHLDLPIEAAAKACLDPLAGPEHWATLIWRLVEDDKLALAEICARSRELCFPSAPPLPSWLFSLASAGRLLQIAGGRVEVTVRDLAVRVHALDWDAIPKPWRPGFRALLSLGLARVAILAPHPSEAPKLLFRISIDEPEIRTFFVDLVAQGGERHQRLDPFCMRSARGAAPLTGSLEYLSSSARQLNDRLAGYGIKSQVGESVWRKWTTSEGWLRKLLAAVINDDRSQIVHCRAIINQYSDDDALDRRIEEDRAERGNRLVAAPRRQLIQHVRDIFEIVENWLSITDALGQSSDPAMLKASEDLWRGLKAQELQTLAEIQSLEGADPVSGAVRACLSQAVQGVMRLFDPEFEMLHGEIFPEEISLKEQLFALELRFNDAGTLSGDPVNNGLWVAGSVVIGLPSEDQIVPERLYRGDFRGARMASLLFETPEVADRDWNLNLKRWREDLELQIQEVSTAIENAAGSPLLEDTLFMEAMASNDEIVDIVANRLGTADSRDLQDRMRRLHNRISVALDKQLEVLRTEFDRDSSLIPEDAPIRQEIVSALEKKELLAAHELLEAARSGRRDPWSKPANLFSAFWPERARQLHEHLAIRDRNPGIRAREILDSVSNRETGGPLYVDPSNEKADIARGMLKQWFQEGRAAEKQRQPEQGRFITEVLSSLGFEPHGLPEPFPKPAKTGVFVNTAPLTDRRDHCPIRTYGSDADGRYRVICHWTPATPQELLSLLDRAPSPETPAIILYFGMLSPMHRKELARLSAERRRTILVLDDILFAHLAILGEAPLPNLFACALPFTWAEPYAITPSTVPPEAFFGRESERQTIIGRSGGTSLIYGGRQLGKTALLREILRRDNRPEDNRIVIYIDLLTEQIGTSFDVGDVWRLIAAQLASYTILHEQTQRGGPDTIALRIKEWLLNHPSAQILVLLDEADRFIEVELKDSLESNIRRFGQLMEDTKQRFKVVFSGLHSVQRASLAIADPNTKLLHYGQPVCIGPLYPQPQDVVAARHLVEEPFAALGYEFESSHLITRILSQCNYYPSLIQLFCQRLHKHLVETKTVVDSPIPRPISKEDVNRAYRDQNLRKEISEKFLATLRLDNRFGVIALHLAYEDSESQHLGMARKSMAIFEGVRDLWPAGFSDISNNLSFMSILDEMVGLGVLRKAGSHEHDYALRSPNIIPMLGTQSDILDRLTDLTSLPAPSRFDVMSFRATTELGALRRAPLTARQVQIIRGEVKEHGVILISGTSGSGLAEVAGWLQTSFQNAFHLMRDEATLIDFQNALNRQRAKVDVTFLVVPASCNWDGIWVEKALEKTTKLRTVDQRLRVVFLMDAKQSMELEPCWLEENKRITSIVLEPWRRQMLDDWLKDDLLIGQQDCVEKVFQATGGWPSLLELFLEIKDTGLHSPEAIKELQHKLSDSTFTEEALRGFGIDEKLCTDLKPMAVLGDSMSPSDFAALAELPEEECRKVIQWGQRTGIIMPSGPDGFVLDRVVSSLITV